MSFGLSRTDLAIALQALALLLLALAYTGAAWLDPRSLPRLLVLVDRSDSMPREASDQTLSGLKQAAHSAGGVELRLLEFAGSTETAAGLEPAATDIGAALEAALAAHAESPFAGATIISDGHATRGDTERALRALGDAGLPLHWIAIGRPPPPVHVVEVLTPPRASAGQPIELSVQLSGRPETPVTVKAHARTAGGDSRTTRVDGFGGGRLRIALDPAQPGPLLVDLTLEDPASGRPIASLPNAALVDVRPRGAILYATASQAVLADSLLRGGWSLTRIAANRLDAHAAALDGYVAVVLDDVAIADAPERFWSALVTAVRQRGLGLLVLGGERSFARGGYRGSLLESVLPLSSEPAAEEAAVNVLFAVDKSGSMGQGSGGVDRFQLAQRAVQETARGLGERDRAGLLVFDIEPRLLVPLAPASAARSSFERDWRMAPGGGTRLAPALDAAIDELQSAPGRRLLVLVTDGFVDNAPLANLRSRLQRANVELVALAVGPDGDVEALQRLVSADSGTVLRVDQAAELPQVMRSGLERRRARIELGTIAVEQPARLPFSPGLFGSWPPVSGHAATRPLPQATVAVQSRRGDPLIAFHDAGLGRVVAISSGLGRWTSRWIDWSLWPDLAGGLADWVGGTSAGGAMPIAVSDQPNALRIETDVAGGIDADAVSVAIELPNLERRVLPVQIIAPGRLRTSLNDAGSGLHRIVVSSARGTRHQWHLRRERGENDAWGVNPMIETWRDQGWISLGSRLPVDRTARAGVHRKPDRALIALALLVFVIGVAVDRLPIAAPQASLRRLRSRLRSLVQRRG